MTYCFICTACGTRQEAQSRTLGNYVCYCGGTWRRDYRAEAVGIGSGVKVSRDGTKLDQARLFLPDNSDFKGPGDPDGTKGMRDWHESFEPRADNPAPTVPGRIERHSF